MSNPEEDTELRDLLIHNLDSSGVLNKIKAEMRAAVFLALEEQDRMENKVSLTNENLRRCLKTSDGRLVAALIVDFMQVFNLDFSLSVFQPEINMMKGLDGRDMVCKDLDLDCEGNRKCPVLLELVSRGRRREGSSVCLQEPCDAQITSARKKFDFYDTEGTGSVSKETLTTIFRDLFPNLNKNMLEIFISDELKDTDSTHNADLQLFLQIYRRLFAQCRSVVCQDSDCVQETSCSPSICKEDVRVGGGGVQQGAWSQVLQRDHMDLDTATDEDQIHNEDSFFDDPLPKPQKTYGGKVEVSGSRLSPPGTHRAAAGGGGAGKSRESKTCSDKNRSRHLDEEVEYDEDFNSHGSELSHSGISIGEDLQDVSIQGPDSSDKVDVTQDVSVSQLSFSTDYMEDVS